MLILLKPADVYAPAYQVIYLHTWNAKQFLYYMKIKQRTYWHSNVMNKIV